MNYWEEYDEEEAMEEIGLVLDEIKGMSEDFEDLQARMNELIMEEEELFDKQGELVYRMLKIAEFHEIEEEKIVNMQREREMEVHE